MSASRATAPRTLRASHGFGRPVCGRSPCRRADANALGGQAEPVNRPLRGLRSRRRSCMTQHMISRCRRGEFHHRHSRQLHAGEWGVRRPDRCWPVVWDSARKVWVASFVRGLTRRRWDRECSDSGRRRLRELSPRRPRTTGRAGRTCRRGSDHRVWVSTAMGLPPRVPRSEASGWAGSQRTAWMVSAPVRAPGAIRVTRPVRVFVASRVTWPLM